MKLRIACIIQTIVEDSYEQGEIGKEFVDFDTCSLTFDSIDEIYEHVRINYGLDSDYFDKNACGEIGRLDASKLADEQGESLSPSKTEKWKLGQTKAYNFHYSFYIDQCTPFML